MDADKLVPKLSSSNYNTWRMQMRMLLTHKVLEYTIEKEERKTEDLLKRSDEDKKKREQNSPEESSCSNLFEGERRIPDNHRGCKRI
jgi:hypothetical protein